MEFAAQKSLGTSVKMWARIFWISCGVPIDLFTTTGVAFVEDSALATFTLDVSALAEPTVGACKVDSALVDLIVVVGALVVVVVLAEAKPRPVAANNVPKTRARNA
jgi:hypothetical protein